MTWTALPLALVAVAIVAYALWLIPRYDRDPYPRKQILEIAGLPAPPRIMVVGPDTEKRLSDMIEEVDADSVRFMGIPLMVSDGIPPGQAYLFDPTRVHREPMDLPWWPKD